MFRSASIGALCLGLSVPLCAQNFDFEDGIADWRQDGSSFASQPYCKEISSTRFAPSKLGGNYWKDPKYPPGQNGNCLLTTIGKHPETTGSLRSHEFPLDKNTPFLSFRIGGTEDLAQERLELQIRVPATAETETLRQIHEWWRQVPALALPDGESLRDGDFLIAAAATGHNSDALRQETVDLPQFLWGLPARFRVLDASLSGHINVDYIRFTANAPAPLRVPVWGFADYHTHPMSYMAFGGLKGIRTLWGIPGGNVDDYVDPTAISRDIPHCTRGHFGGYFAEAFINSSQLLHYNLPSVVRAILFPHKRRGGPEFKDFPDHMMGAHEQMHITQIRRSYDGGLRLMVALATDNKAPQFLTGTVKNGHMDLVSEKDSIEAQLRGMVTVQGAIAAAAKRPVFGCDETQWRQRDTPGC